MKSLLKLLVQTIFLILLIPSFLLGFIVGMVFHPAQTGFLVFKLCAEYITDLRKGEGMR